VDDPAPRGLVVGGQVAGVQPQGDVGGGAGVEADLGEPLELAGWLGGGGRGGQSTVPLTGRGGPSNTWPNSRSPAATGRPSISSRVIPAARTVKRCTPASDDAQWVMAGSPTLGEGDPYPRAGPGGDAVQGMARRSAATRTHAEWRRR